MFKVVLLEDESTHVELIKKLLHQIDAPIDLQVFRDSKSFVSGFSEINPDLLISDYFIDEMNGLDALYHAHDTYPELPVILMSGLMDEDNLLETMNKGASDVVSKDNLRRLIPAINRELENYRLSKQRERKLMEAKERYRALVHSIKGLVWEANTEPFSFNYISPKIEEIFGFKSDTFYDDPDSFFQLIHEEDKNRVKHFYLNFDSSSKYGEVEYRITNKYNDIIWIRETLSNHKLHDGQPVIRGMMIDITESKAKELLLQKTIKEKEALIAEVYHRVKNNMAVVSGMMQLQYYTESDEYVQAKLLDAVNRIQTMASIHEIFYDSLSSTTIFKKEHVEELILEIIHQYGIKENDFISASFSLEETEIDINHAIPFALIINEVVTNCVKHAFKEIEDKQIEVILSTENSTVSLVIQDNGIGFPLDIDKKTVNSSLGLTIINALAEQLGADYSYDNTGAGTKFSINFPN